MRPFSLTELLIHLYHHLFPEVIRRTDWIVETRCKICGEKSQYDPW